MKRKLFFLLNIFLYSISAFAQSNIERNDSLDLLFHDLPEVVVKGERPIAKMENGKIVYQMPLLLEKIPADNAYDALTKLPGVYAQSDKIQFASKPVSIIINGKVTTLSYEEVVEKLKTMPAERLEKAELMLTAPANLHVRGAVLNIITKNYNGNRHVSGQLSGTYTQSKYASEGLSGNLLFSNKKWTIDANYSFSHKKSFNEAEHKAMHPLASGPMEYADYTDNTTADNYHHYRLGVDYQFSKEHLLSMAYNGSYCDYESNNNTTGNSISKQALTGHSTLNNVELNYMLPFGLKMSASYTGYRSPENQDLDGALEQENKHYISSSNQQIDKFMFTADQVHQLKNNWSVSYGAKAQFTSNNSFQKTYNGEGNVLPEATSQVSIDERIVNAYAGFNKQFNKNISIDASVTVENYHTPKWNEWRVYPQFSFMWNVNDNHMLNLSLSSDAYYPSYWSTMSGISYSSIYSEIWGNPDLKPTSDYNLSLMWQINRKYTIVAFTDISPNFSTQLPYQTTDRMAVIMKMVNFDHRNRYGMQANATFKLGSWLNGNAFVGGIYTNDKCQEFFDLPFDRNKFVFITGGNASMTLSKKHHINMTLNPFFQTDAIQGVYDIKDIFRLDAKMRWTSNNKCWNVVLSGNNLTNNHFRTHSMFGNQDFAMKVCQNWINVSLTCIYKFGNYKEKKVKEVDTSRMGH